MDDDTRPEHQADVELREHTWAEFRESGMLWVANRILHVFGWAIVVGVDDDTGEVSRVYPARTPWRGFSAELDARGFERVSRWMALAGGALEREAKGE